MKLSVKLDDTNHHRRIETNHGWRVQPGRGLGLLRGAFTPALYPGRHQRELTGWGDD